MKGKATNKKPNQRFFVTQSSWCRFEKIYNKNKFCFIMKTNFQEKCLNTPGKKHAFKH